MDRYSRQERLIGKEAQEKLSRATVTVVGAGALGSAALQVLARAGIGKIRILEYDVLGLDNLQRQIVYSEEDVGKKKAILARDLLGRINPSISITSIDARLDKENCGSLAGSDIVLGCTDNLESRFLINEYCVKNRIPWVHGGAVRTVGNLMVIMPGGPCFRCIFKPSSFSETAASHGISGSIPVIIGAMQANEAINILTGKPHEHGLIYLDISENRFSRVQIQKSPDCEVCS